MPLYNPPASSANLISSNIGTNTGTKTISSTGQSICAANADRKGLSIFNTSGITVYVDVLGSITTSNYMVAIPGGGYFEFPITYTGLITAIAASAATLTVREFV
jgi:hypothetical protein